MPLISDTVGISSIHGGEDVNELLFRDDAYLKTATARVVAVHERGLELDRTIFLPPGLADHEHAFTSNRWRGAAHTLNRSTR